MSGYEHAAATKLLATHCAACGRPLLDAQSVETGMGPDCRRRYGYHAEVTEAQRAEANHLVHALAASADEAHAVKALARLQELGFERLAERIAQRRVKLRIERDGDRLVIHTPYRRPTPALISAWRAIPGRRWEGARRANTAPIEAKPHVWALLRRFFPGVRGLGPKGAFAIPGDES